MGDVILGGGMAGLAAGLASGLPVFEASERAGGICCSCFMRPSSTERLAHPPADDDAYRFELGGGHWIFGGEPAVLQFIRDLVAIKTYERKSSAFWPPAVCLSPTLCKIICAISTRNCGRVRSPKCRSRRAPSAR